MRICQDHWNKIRAALRDHGIDHLGAKTGEEAHAAMVEEVQGGHPPYDPLMSCNWMIQSKALDAGGLYLMTNKDDGTPYCPICEALVHKPEDVTLDMFEKFWIDGPANAALDEARRCGLVSNVQ